MFIYKARMLYIKHATLFAEPKCCVLSPLLYTYDCSLAHENNKSVKFAEFTTVVRLISRGDEAAYKRGAPEADDVHLWQQPGN